MVFYYSIYFSIYNPLFTIHYPKMSHSRFSAYDVQDSTFMAITLGDGRIVKIFTTSEDSAWGDVAWNFPALNNMIGCKITSVKQTPGYGSIRDDRRPCFNITIISINDDGHILIATNPVYYYSKDGNDDYHIWMGINVIEPGSNISDDDDDSW